MRRRAPLVGVAAPMPEELAPLLRTMAGTRRCAIEGRRFHCGRIGRVAAVATATGDGPRRAARGAALLLDHFPLTHLLVLGVAGGLSPSLAPGDVLAAGEVRAAGFDLAAGGARAPGADAAPPPDPRLLEAALRIEGVREGVVVTTPALVGGRSEKEAIRKGLPRERPAAVDLESMAFALAAAERQLPYLVLRAISDAATEDLPAILLHCQGPDGGVDRRRVLRRALLHPRAIPELLRLRRRVAFCGGRLCGVVRMMLAGEGSLRGG